MFNIGDTVEHRDKGIGIVSISYSEELLLTIENDTFACLPEHCTKMYHAYQSIPYYKHMVYKYQGMIPADKKEFWQTHFEGQGACPSWGKGPFHVMMFPARIADRIHEVEGEWVEFNSL
jgi:hypothetical protein